MSDPPPALRPEPFRCDVVRDAARVRVAPRGELDVATVDRVRAAVGEALAAGPPVLVLDLRDVTFMDSTGLRLIMALDAESRRDGLEFSLIAGPSGTQRVLSVAGVLDRLTFEPPGE